jgi:hypothetical protein
VRRSTITVLVILATVAAACGWLARPSRPVTPAADDYSPAYATFGGAVRDFFGIRRAAVQPIEFPHKTHLAKDIACATCHEGAAKGPVAGIPGVKTCMICHESIATDRPLIQKVADYDKRKIDIPWQRVYGYPRVSHVRFQHAPHVSAGVDCATCHGNLAQQTVAERSVDLTMAFCVSCHKSKRAPNDCQTCHF